MTEFLLRNVPALPLGLAAIAVAVAGSLGGLWLVNRSRELTTLESHNDVAGFIFAVVGVIYGVQLAFVVVAVWERFDAASATAGRESDLAVALYRDAAVFPENSASIRNALRDYARSVVDDEWPNMADLRGDSRVTDEKLHNVSRAYRAIVPKTREQEVFFTESVRQLDQVSQARGERLVASTTSLPAVLWVLVVIGGVITIGFTYFFWVPNKRAHALMVASLAAAIALSLFLIASLEHPFTGDSGVRPDAIEDAAREFLHIDAIP